MGELTFEDHLVLLRKSLLRFREHKLKLKPRKCNLFQLAAKVLGHILDERGIAVNPENIEKIAKTRTTPYHPSSNGQVERYNRTLLQLIRCFLGEDQRDWDNDLPLLAGVIRSMPNRSTGFTPIMLMLGREVHMPSELVLSPFLKQPPAASAGEYVLKLREKLEFVHHIARQHLGVAEHRRKKDYDVQLREKRYQAGDIVYKSYTASKVGQSSKLRPPWLGPFLVEKAISPVLYLINGQSKNQVVHHDRLKLCRDRILPFWLRRKRHHLLGPDDSVIAPCTDSPDMETGVFPFCALDELEFAMLPRVH
ncbi:uncharacterized protein LOC135501689 [Lineus longissimus]|uniref:uncharacterized protein LOC135501689 n=1 Tax=Lineus longissimus TaxID=88925 RepID=UPI00315C6EE2